MQMNGKGLKTKAKRAKARKSLLTTFKVCHYEF
jgi:hypothetical protein